MMLSVIIVNWNSKEYLRAALHSLFKQTTSVEMEVVVVDGASFDGCDAMLASDFPQVKFIQSHQNVGFGRCNNLGAEAASGKFLLLLNPDTELKAGALESMINAFEALPKAGLLGPRLLNSDGSLQMSCVQSLPTPINQALDSEWLRRRFPRSSLWGIYPAFEASTAVPVEALSGACMLIEADTFRQVGGFSPQYFMYGEDMDLCAKVQKQGLGVYHLPTVEIIHHGGGSSSGKFSKVASVFLRQSIYQFITTHQGRFAGVLYRGLMAITAVIRLGLLGVASLVASDQFAASRRLAALKWRAILRWSAGLEHGLLRSIT